MIVPWTFEGKQIYVLFYFTGGIRIDQNFQIRKVDKHDEIAFFGIFLCQLITIEY